MVIGWLNVLVVAALFMLLSVASAAPVAAAVQDVADKGKAQQAEQRPMAGPAACSIDIHIRPKTQKVERASFSCTGERAAVQVDKLLAGYSSSFVGVDLTDCGRARCLVKFCGRTQAMLTNITIFGASMMGLCVLGTANVTITGSSVIANNSNEGRKDNTTNGGGMWATGNSILTITGTTRVANNTSVLGQGGGLAAEGNSVVFINGNSRVELNRAVNASGAGLSASGNAIIHISGNATVRQNFCARRNGGGIYATGNATITLRDGASLYGNAAVNASGGAIAADDKATVDVGPHVLLANNSVGRFGKFDGGADIGMEGDGVRLLLDPQGTLNMCSRSVRLQRMSCDVGQFFRNDACVCCPNGTYTFRTNSSEYVCDPCPMGGVCPGGAVIVPLAGYWHSTPRSTQIHRCPAFTAACGEQGVCRSGHQGNLCASCITPAVAFSAPFKCVRCGNPKHHLAMLAVFGFLTALFVVFTVHLAWREAQARYPDLSSGPQHGESDKRLPVKGVDMVKALVRFLQYTVIIGSVYAPWPSAVQGLFKAASVVFAGASGGVFSVDCWLTHLPHARVPLALQRQLLWLLLPVFLFLVAAVIHALVSICQYFLPSFFPPRHCGSSSCAHFVSKLLTTLLVLAFFAYPTLVKVSLSFFACLSIDVAGQGPYPEYATTSHPRGYWVEDAQQACFAGWHRGAVALGAAAVLVFCVAAPVGVVLLARRVRSCMHPDTKPAKCRNSSACGACDVLCSGYADSKCWWEAVWMCETIILTLVAVFQHTLGPFYSLLLLQVAILLGGVVQGVAKPYAQHQLHVGTSTAAACLFLTTTAAIGLFGFEQGGAAVPSVNTGVGVLVVIINAAFIAWCVFGTVVASSTAARRAVSRLHSAVGWNAATNPEPKPSP